MLWYRRKVGYCRKGFNCNFKNLLSVKGRAPSLSAERLQKDFTKEVNLAFKI